VNVSEYRTAFFSSYLGPTSNISFLRRIDSTNAMARRMVTEFLRDDEKPPRTALLAIEQTAGRGRRGRSWESPAAQGVYVTLLLPLADASELQWLPMKAAVGLARAIEELVGKPCQLKWPNDLLVGGAKIGGILIESVAVGERSALAILGFGVNHGTPPSAVADRQVTSLASERPSVMPLPAAAGCLLGALESALSEPLPAGEYARRSVHRPGDTLSCQVGEEAVRGEFMGFDAHGFLRLQTAAGERVLSSAEVIEK
jgi:BirA family biotin operon repressor/biotin-[acetyl-CoA-carboxylase] ligase